MRTKIDRVMRAFASEAWAIMPEKLSQIAAVLELRASGDNGEISAEEIRATVGARTRAKVRSGGGGVMVLPLYGVVAHRMNLLTEISGGTSTERFGQQFDEAMDDESISAIVIDVDSPGGSVSGVEELSRKIYDARGRKPIVAISNTLMASAAYYIASSADEVIATPSSLTGSIGTILVHSEYSRAYETKGISNTVISAGRYKAEGNSFEPLDEEAQAALQSMVDEYYRQFIDAVARNRGVSAAEVENGYGQGRALPARQALAANLVDRILTFDELLAEFGVGRRQAASPNTRGEAEQAEPIDAAGPIVIELAGASAENLTTTVGAGLVGASHWAGVERAPLRLAPAADEGPEQETAEAEENEIDEVATAEEGTAEVDEPEPLESNAAQAAEEEAEMSKETETAAQGGAANGGGTAVAEPHVSAGEDRALERQRAVAIMQLCMAHGVPDRATDFISQGASLEDVGAKLQAEAQEGLERMRTAAVDLSPAEAQRYSLTKAILASADDDWSGAPFEKEVSDAIRGKLPDNYKPRGGFFVPIRGASPLRAVTPAAIERMQHVVATAGLPAATQARLLMQIGQMHPQAALDSATSTGGQELVFTEAGDFIDLLRNRMMVAQLGATVLSGLQGPVSFPKQTGAGTFEWVGESPGSDQSDSDMTLTQVALNPKTGQSTTGYSRQLLAQNVVDVDNLVKMDLALITALGIDLGAINGSGSGNEPTGILNTSGVNVVALGTDGAVPTWANLVDLETQVSADNADIGTEAILTTPGVRGLLKSTPKVSGYPVFMWENGEVNGYRAEVSNQMPKTLTKGTGTGLHAIIQGVWNTLMIGYWGAYELVVDPYSKKKQGLIELTSFQMAGIALRYPVAFAAIKDAALS